VILKSQDGFEIKKCDFWKSRRVWIQMLSVSNGTHHCEILPSSGSWWL